MKSNKIKEKDVKKDPIKDKYTQKIGFFKKIKVKAIQTVNFIKGLKKHKKELIALLTMCGEVVAYGVLGGLGLSLFGVSFGFITVLGSGSILWLIEKKIAGVLSGILGSISLVKIYN